MNDKIKVAVILALAIVVASSVMVFSHDEVEAVEAGSAESFDSAIANHTGSGTVYIDLTDDITFSDTYTISKKVNLDLNGFDIVFLSGGFNVSGTLTVGDSTASDSPVVGENYSVSYTSGTISSPDNTITAYDGGSVVIKKGHIEGGNIALYAQGNIVPGGNPIGSSITVEDGYITCQEFCLSPQGNGASVTVEGGVLESRDNAVVAGNGTLDDSKDLGGTSITIEGGTIIGNITTGGYVACGIYAPNYGSVVMTGGTIYVDGGVGILARAGTVDVWGGDIIVTGDDNVLGKVGDSRVVVTASAIIVDQEAGYPGIGNGAGFSTTIYGGNFTSESSEIVRQIDGDSTTDSKINIRGGHFSSSPDEDFLGGNSYDVETGEVTTPVDDAVVTVNGLGYPSLYEAFINCSSETMNIVLKQDDTFSYDYTIPAGKSVTLDLSGHTITFEAKITIGSGASLTINDSGTDGKITGSIDSMMTIKGELELNGGTIEVSGNKAVYSNSGSVFTINGGTVHGIGDYALYAYSGTVNILGGNVTSTDSSKLIYCGSKVVLNIGSADSAYSPSLSSITLSGNVVNIHKGNIGSVTGKFHSDSIIGCTFTEDPSNAAPAGKIGRQNEDGTWFIDDMVQDDAVAEVDGVYYRSIADAAKAVTNGSTLTLWDDVAETFTINAYQCVIDLNGHDITVTDGYGLKIQTKYGTEWVDGTVTLRSSDVSTISAPTPVYIKSGNSQKTITVEIGENIVLTPSGESGAVLLDTSARMLYSDNTAGFFKEGGFVATVGGVEYAYGSMSAALKDSDDDSTKLLNDYNNKIAINTAGNWTIDLNEKTVTSDSEGIYIGCSDCHLKVINGSIKANLDGATVAVAAVGSPSEGTIVYNNSSLTLDGVNLSSNLGGMNDDSYYGIVTNGMSKGMAVTIRNSTVTSEGHAVYFPSDGTLTIENSVITGDVTGIEIRAGTLNISGDQTKITGNGEFDHTSNGSGTTIGGVAIAVSQHTTNHNLSVNISGGTFTGKYALYEEDLQDSDVSNITLSITGGTFTGTTASLSSENVVDFVTAGTFMGTVDEKYIAPGSSLTQNEDGTYTASVAQTSSSLTVSDETPSQNDEVTATFTIEGAPTDGAAFKWTFNGNIADETGSTYTFKAERSGTLTVEVTIDVYGIEKTFTGSVDITVTVPTTPEDPDEGETTVTIDKDGNTVTETTRPDGSSTVTTEKPPVKEDGNTVTETIVKDTDSDGSTTTTTETKYESDSATTTVTEVEDASGNTTVQSQTSVTVDETQDVAVVDKEAITAAIEHMVSIVNDTTAEKVVTVETSKEQVTLPANISDVTDAGATLEVVSNIGTVKVDSDVVETLVSDGKDVTITQKDADTSDMNASQQQAVGGNRVIELTASNDDRNFHQLGGTVEVVVKNYVLPDGVDADSVVVFYVDDNGRLSQKLTTYDADTGLLRFWTDHFSYYVIGNTSMITQDQPDDKPVNPGWNPGQDDDVWIPPTVVVEESGSQSGTIEIVACAAAAVVAALMAAFLIIERRKS